MNLKGENLEIVKKAFKKGDVTLVSMRGVAPFTDVSKFTFEDRLFIATRINKKIKRIIMVEKIPEERKLANVYFEGEYVRLVTETLDKREDKNGSE